MAVVTVRNIPEATHRALKLLAAQHGHSTESEIRSILEAAARPQQRLKIGSELAALGQKLGSVEFARDRRSAEPAQFD